MKLIKKMRKGFTLIELVVVIAVIAILSAVSVVAYVGITNNAKKSTAEQEAAQLKTMLRAELTRENYEYYESAALVYTFKLDAENDRIVYKAEAGATATQLNSGLTELITICQGYEKTETAKSKYRVAQDAGEEQFGVRYISDGGASDVKLNKFPNQLVLCHSNGQKGAIIGFAAEA